MTRLTYTRYIFIIKLKSLDKKYNVHPQTDKVKAKKMHTLPHRQFYSPRAAHKRLTCKLYIYIVVLLLGSI